MKLFPSVLSDELRHLAASYGVQASYQDFFGKTQAADFESLLPVLKALGAPVQSLQDLPRALREKDLQSWQTGLEPVAVAWDGKLAGVWLRLPASQSTGLARCRIEFESGQTREWDAELSSLETGQSAEVEGIRHITRKMALRVRFPLGYHKLRVSCRAGEFQCLVISAPVRAFDKPGKSWGVFLPLYALASKASWGVGDFSDVLELQRWASRQGAEVVSTLPLMAAFLGEPYEISPYMPASRLFWNEIFLDPRQSPDFQACAAARSLAQTAQFQKELAALGSSRLVDHRRAMALKRPVLEAMARWLMRSGTRRAGKFREHVANHPFLSDYARFRATAERQKAPWTDWPVRLRDGTLRPGDYLRSDELYHQYVQWLAEEQIARVAGRTPSRPGSRTGLYLDFPLGVHPASYDVWRNQSLFALGVSTGAPPDPLFSNGQNWAFPPPHPERMRQQGYAYQIACLRQQLRHTKWLRMDHVMGLHRLFWIPQGFDARRGVYVRYAAEELYAILTLESHRAKAMVVGEDLGTVPPEVTRAMNRHGLKRMYVLQYEVRPDSRPCLRPPPSNAVASLNTHDMPPFKSFWDGIDLHEMESLGLVSKAEAHAQIRRRGQSRKALESFLHLQKPGKSASSALALLEKCQQWLADSRAKMLLVNLEDLWGETVPQNVPGTNLERANWQRRARYPIEQFSTLAAVTGALETIRQHRNRKAVKEGAAGLK